MRNTGRLWRTVRDLKPAMIVARLTHRVRKHFFRFREMPEAGKLFAENHPTTSFPRLPEKDILMPDERVFTLLNQPYFFENFPDWNHSGFGALWNYRLNGFGWLEAFYSEDERVNALVQSRAKCTVIKATNAMHPAALRLENGIRHYLSSPGVRTKEVLQMLWKDYDANLRFPEKHLDGNHLLQSYLAAFQGSIFFGETSHQQTSGRALTTEIGKQFLTDGCHYERSILYTASILASLAKTVHLMDLLAPDSFPDVKQRLETTFQNGISFLEEIAFSDGSFPAFGDSQTELSPSFRNLQLALPVKSGKFIKTPLGECGIRKMTNGFLELRVQCGSISPAFQPGHSHADTGSFCLHANGKPFITDTGISTYNRNDLRQRERSTAAHNTVVINGENSSEVWAAFRVGRKARVTILEDRPLRLQFMHDGYRHLGIRVKRTFCMHGDALIIEDEILGRSASCEVLFHLHPEVEVESIASGTVRFTNGLCMTITGASQINQKDYEWCEGYNLRRRSTCLRITPAANHLQTHFPKQLSA